MKNTRYFIEAVFAFLLFGIFRLLPASAASCLGGFLGRTIGPHLGSSRRAIRHIQKALPGTDDKAAQTIMRGHWNNMGRVIAEYQHLKKLARKNVIVEGDENLRDALGQNKGAVFIGAHQGNWELNCLTLFIHYNAKSAVTYRAMNNPYVDRMIEKSRTLNGTLSAFPKSRESGRKIMATIKDGGYLGILIDQKYNEGIEIPFFGLPAMTNPIAFQLAQKYHAPLVPVQNIRLKGANFKIIVHPAIPTHDGAGAPRPLEDMMLEAHRLMEGWIHAHPAQWIWMHRRWKETSGEKP